MGVAAVFDANVALFWLAQRLEEPIPEAGVGISVITEMELLCYPFADPADETAVREFTRDV